MTKFLKQVFAFSFLSFASIVTVAQDNTPQLLKEPAGWEFERFPLPPVFAPNFPYKGAEELRFAPGMFKKDAPDYFTYAFVAQLDDVADVSRSDVKNYLLTYFKGLCAATARDRKLTVDTSNVTVALEPNKKSQKSAIIYDATLNVFGVFADGAPVKLNAEVKLLHNVKEKKVYLLFITSPQEKTNEVWKVLYKIQKDFVIPA